MEAKLMKIFPMLMLFCLCNRGNAECTLSDLHVTQTTTGKNVGGHPEYSVEVVNGCICSQLDIKLLCPEFNSSESVDPHVVSPDPDGKLCTFNDGAPVFYGDKAKFNYASATKISFAPVSSIVSCS